MTTHSPPGLTARTGRNLLVGVAALILAGCGSGKDGSEAATGSASSKPTSPTPLAAADGTSLSACKDGTCEVKVTGPAKLPVDRKKFKIHTLKVSPDKGDTVSFTIEDSSAVSSISVRVCGPDGRCFALGGGGYASGGENQSVKSSTGWSAAAGTRITANGIFITVVSVADGSAILRLRPA